jgi:DNA-binding GntR family transcriptional regulator
MSGPEPPKYRMIMEHLKERMERGELRPGDRMPTVRALSDAWKISHVTATKVLRELCREGYAYVENKATYVRDRGQAALTLTRVEYGGRKRSGGGGLGGPWNYNGPAVRPGWAEVVHANVVAAPDYVADVMEVPRGTEVLRIEIVQRWRPTMAGAVRLDPEPPLKPFALSVHWYPAEWARLRPELLHTGLDDANSPLVDLDHGGEIVERQLGRQPIVGLEAYHARLADAREARWLEIEEGAPVLGCVETWQDDLGVTEYKESVYPAGVVRMVAHRDPAERDPEE